MPSYETEILPQGDTCAYINKHTTSFVCISMKMTSVFICCGEHVNFARSHENLMVNIMDAILVFPSEGGLEA